MTASARPLPAGLYEHLLTHDLERALAHLDPATYAVTTLDAAAAGDMLARHVAREVERALRDVAKKHATEAQTAIVNALLARLTELAADADAAPDRIAPPPRRLDAIHATPQPLPRPNTPLSSTTLLTRNREEPALGQELALEIASADEVHALVAFVTLPGVRALRASLEDFARRGGKLRLLTTTFTATTELAALDALATLPGAEVRVSYDTRRTRLHAKAWLFKRNTGLHTAYVGSANLTSTALGSGQEWMVKVCAADLPHVIAKFEGTFESLFHDPEFIPYDPRDDLSRARLTRALAREADRAATTPVFFDLRPFPFQEEILDRLEVERQVHGRTKNLVVAATGTGKTVVAAFDYLRQKQAAGLAPRLLFLAHRKEILDQARQTFRQVLREASFGDFLGDGHTPERWDHLFATVQTATRRIPASLPPDHFHYVVIDECHHLPADTYRALLDHLRPNILLGLTATPERADGKPLLPDFDHHIAAELRLWHATERQLLVPFEYYGVADDIDLRSLRWQRTGYRIDDLTNLYTGNEARVDRIVAQLAARVASLRTVRALAFCVSVEHAEYMAAALTRRGIPAEAVHGDTPDEDRAAIRDRLERRDINIICTCDLYNEGVDLPFVDALLLLRPTQSPTLFIQQIGRGLRHHDKKPSCLVLDFIGQHHQKFRFDTLFSALTGIPRARLRREVERGFPYLPSGCVLQLDQVARTRVLDSLKATLGTRAALIDELRELSVDPAPLTLARYLDHTGRDPDDVYAAGGWTKLRHEAGLLENVDDHALDLSKRLSQLLHIDEPSRLRALRAIAETPEGSSWTPANDTDRIRATMLDARLEHRGVLRAAEEAAHYIRQHPPVREELTQLTEVLEDRIATPADVYPVPEWPLALHRHYTRIESVTAVGYLHPGKKKGVPQGGILKLDDKKRELLFVTLDKSAKSFSPTTRYRDYAISRDRFHWETQGAASVTRESGRRYIESPANGWSFYLLVRADPDAPYAFLGEVRYESHRGDRPIGITWRLERAMPAGLFDRFATLVQG